MIVQKLHVTVHAVFLIAPAASFFPPAAQITLPLIHSCLFLTHDELNFNKPFFKQRKPALTALFG